MTIGNLVRRRKNLGMEMGGTTDRYGFGFISKPWAILPHTDLRRKEGQVSMDAYFSPGRLSASGWMLTAAAFQLIACETNLVTRILSGAEMRIYPWNYALPLMVMLPLVMGLGHIRRMKKLETSGDVSSGVARRINSDVSCMVLIAYCAFLIFSRFW
jgi:hypothetical protein